MNQCKYCKNDLPTSLDEFGDPREPCCQSCFLSGKEQDPEIIETLQKLQEEEKYLNSSWDDIEDQLDDLRSQQVRIEDDINDNRKQQKLLNNMLEKSISPSLI
jgi:hypothetical protein